MVTITIAGDELTVDLTGTSPQVSDRPINLPFEGTTDCAIWLTLRSILLDSAVYGHIPQNSGLTRPITIVAPTGTLANPIFPAPVIARFCPGNQLADTVMKALAQAVPRQVSAGVGNLRVIAFSGAVHNHPWVHMEIFEGSYGGRFGREGMDAVDTLYANTRNNPIEDIESHLPLRVNRYELREGVVAAGQWRGGSARCGPSPICQTADFRSKATARNTGPGDLPGAATAIRAIWCCRAKMERARRCPRRCRIKR